MKVVIKKYYFFNNEDKKKLKVFLAQKDMSYQDFASKIGISKPLLSAIVNGKRALTPNVAKKFVKKGFKVELE